MRKCNDLMEHLSAYADGEYSGAEKRQMEAHLLSCKNCSELLKLYRDISKASLEATVPAPQTLVSNVMERVHSDGVRVENRSKRYSRNRVLLTKYAPIAACLAILLLAIPFALPYIFGQYGAVSEERDRAALFTDAAPEMEVSAGISAPDVAADAMSPEFDMDDEMVVEERHAFDDSSIQRQDGTEAEAFGMYDAEAEELAPESAEAEMQPEIFGLFLIDEGDRIYVIEEYIQHSVPLPRYFEFRDSTIATYFTKIVITGQLPELLDQYVPLDYEELAGVDHIIYVVPRETARRIIDEMRYNANFGFTPINADGEYALVILLPY